MPVKKYYKQPVVLEAKDGVVTKVKRIWDGSIISVGMDTKSGGKIISLKWDTSAVAEMYAEIGRPGYLTSVSAIAL
jgi:hypothetical protein